MGQPEDTAATQFTSIPFGHSTDSSQSVWELLCGFLYVRMRISPGAWADSSPVDVQSAIRLAGTPRLETSMGPLMSWKGKQWGEDDEVEEARRVREQKTVDQASFLYTGCQRVRTERGKWKVHERAARGARPYSYYNLLKTLPFDGHVSDPNKHFPY